MNKIGWNQESIAKGCLDLNISSGLNGIVSPFGVIRYLMGRWSREALESLNREGSDFQRTQKVRERVLLGVRARLTQQLPYLPRWSEAMAIGAHPENARETAGLLWNYADEVWVLAGDRSLDYNYYTKRGLFVAVYASTELYMLSDQSENHAETWGFLERRIDNVLQIGQKVSFYKNFSTATLSGVTDVLSALKPVPANPDNNISEIRSRVLNNAQQQEPNSAQQPKP